MAETSLAKRAGDAITISDAFDVAGVTPDDTETGRKLQGPSWESEV